MARQERGADIAKLRGRVITGLLSGGPAVVPIARDPAVERPEHRDGCPEAGIWRGAGGVGAAEHGIPDRSLTWQPRSVRQVPTRDAVGPGAPGRLPEFLDNGLPRLGGPGYNLRLPCAEEITETHEHE